MGRWRSSGRGSKTLPGDIQLVVSLSALIISSSILTGVGIIAGMIPAIRASRLDPVLAMRSD